MKVYISPQFDRPDRADGGIRRVIEALNRHLPEYGIEITRKLEDADLVNVHAMDQVEYSGRPMVHSCHGLHWSNYQWGEWAYQANQLVINNLVRAQAVTAPSRWVKHALSYGLLKPIKAIHHGIDLNEWKPGQNGGYVLWNKARADIISNPQDMQRFASVLTDLRFVSTLGTETENVRVVGVRAYAEMKQLIQGASLYLCTARETFGIGTLEALASGVPVIGWDFGGQSEIISQGETGYLVPYGDYEGLRNVALEAYADRKRLSANCLEDAKRWKWKDQVKHYAALFQGVYDEWHTPRPTLSIIVTSYNLGRYLVDCLRSVAQWDYDLECIVVDDCSEDNTAEVARSFAINDTRFRYVRPAQNLGLSGARNYGFSHSTGKYILPLDADDLLNPQGVLPLIEALDQDSSIHIAYGNLLMISEDAQTAHRTISQTNDFDWHSQLSHINQPFYCALMRREVLENSGGYRVRDWRAEDASFWARVTSYGFRARKASQEPTIYYRLRENSKGAQERANYEDGDGDWLAWYGWKMASDYQAGLEARKRKAEPEARLVPFAAQGEPKPTWNADHRQEPLVSVIIPVGPGHDKYLVDTLDSLIAQTCQDYEAVVINDTGQALDLKAYPWARVVNTLGSQGAGRARNAGLEAARGPLCLFLDADDWLLSNALRDMLAAYAVLEGQRYIYTNYISVNPQGNVKHERLKKYDQTNWRGQHAVTVLMQTEDALRIGGYDEDMPGWEDWDFAIKCAINGICGHLIPVETFVYRNFSGERRDKAASDMDNLLPVLKERYQDYYRGAKEIMACGCKGNAQAIIKAKSYIQQQISPLASRKNGVKSGMTRMKFIGSQPSKVFIRVGGQKLSRVYNAGNNAVGRYFDADPADVELLISTGLVEVEQRPQNAGSGQNTPAPKPIHYEAPKPVDLLEIKRQAARAAMDEPPSVPEVEATPGAIKEADSLGVDIAKIDGTGQDGKVTVYDVRRYAKELV